MTKTEVIIVFILAVWLLLSVLYPIFNRRMGIYTGRFDVFRWISAYQLFSREIRNFRLSYCEKLSDNKKTDWQQITLTPSRKWYHGFWFPEGLISETVYSFVDDLVRFLDAKKDTAATRKVSERFIYRFIMRFVNKIPTENNVSARQFKIEEISGHLDKEDFREIFISDFHNR